MTGRLWSLPTHPFVIWTNINNGTGSTAGHIILLMDCHGKYCPLSWHGNKIKRVVRSTIAAEALSLQEVSITER